MMTVLLATTLGFGIDDQCLRRRLIEWDEHNTPGLSLRALGSPPNLALELRAEIACQVAGQLPELDVTHDVPAQLVHDCGVAYVSLCRTDQKVCDIRA
jgi:hypothetical protein